jgi:Icc-related predicted phosphoesterase
MKIWFISDSHRQHPFLDIPADVDMVIFGGDMSNQKNPAMNANEVLDFIEWYKSLVHIKYKILIAGNHDTSIEQGLVKRSDMEGLIYLEHESITIEGIKIFGSPYTPKFGTGWAYNVPRGRLSSYWDEIPKDTDILITHGPPKGVLDITQYDSRDTLIKDSAAFFQCGCLELLQIVKEIQPKYHVFGHIHPEKYCLNNAQVKINGCSTTFINAAICNLSGEIHNNGFLIDY